MQVAKDKVVQFLYTLKDDQGELIEQTEVDAPMAYLHGHNNMFPAVEAEMEGKAVGDQFSVTLKPEDAYGERVEDSVQRVPAKHLQGAKKWRPGMVAIVNTDQSQCQDNEQKGGKI